MAEVPKPAEASEAADSHVNGATHKEVLAPSEGPREDLIKTAIKFLLNPRVRTSPLSQKKSFLERKGLTHEEITIAIERSGVTEDSTPPRAHDNSGVYPPASYPPPGMAVAPVPYPPPMVPIPPQSRWAQARDLTLTSVIVASVSYAVYQLFQTYLRPLFFGKTVHERRIEKLESQVEAIQKSVSDSLVEIGQTLQAIQASITAHQAAQPSASQVDAKAVTDLKSDITSLKGLLLNRNQFPPAPATSPMLPSWQRISPSPPALNANLANQSSVPSLDASKPDSENDKSNTPTDKKMDTLGSLTELNFTDGADAQNELHEDVTDTISNLDDQD